MDQKLGAVPLFVGAGSPSNTMWPGPRPAVVPIGIFIRPAFRPQQTWAEKWGLWRFGAGSPSNTMWPGPRPATIPSGILTHATVWPQYTNVTDRQTGQTDMTDTQGSDSIELTVLQAVAQNFTISTTCCRNGKAVAFCFMTK